MSFNTKFLIEQGRKKLKIQESSLPKINQKIYGVDHNNVNTNVINFSKNDLQQMIEIYCKDAYDRKNDDKQFIISKVCKLPFLKKAIRRKGEAFMIQTLNQMTLEYYNVGQELYNINQGNKQNFYILLSGSVGVYVQNEQLFIEEKEEELKRAQALKDKQDQVMNEQNAAANGNKLFNIEVKQMGQAMIKKKTDGYVDKQREKENQQIQNRSQLKSQNDSKISSNNIQAQDPNNSQIYLQQHLKQGDTNKKNTKDAITKERMRELNQIQENLVKKQAREFKELKTIQGLTTLGEKKTIQGEGNQDIQKIVAKSGQVIVLMLKGEIFRQQFNDLIESEEKIGKIAFFLSIPLFSNFKMREINQILQKTKIQLFKKQQLVYNENDIAENLFIVKKGEFAIQKEIVIKNPQMPDLYNKRTVKNIEICSLAEGQYFGLDELLECTLLQNQEEQQPNDTNNEITIIKRINSVKCLTAESELFVIPYDSFKKYINPEMLNIDQDSMQQQADMRNEILSKKKQQQERQEMRVLAIKKTIKSEQSKYHQIQDEMNIQQKEKQHTYYQKFLNDSSSAFVLPNIDNQNGSIQYGHMRREPSFYKGKQYTDPDLYNKSNSIDCFLTKLPDQSQIFYQKGEKYPNLLEKLPQRNNNDLNDNRHVSSQNNMDQIKDNISEFNKNISIYNENMQKYIRAVSEFSEKMQSEPSPFRQNSKQNIKSHNNSYVMNSNNNNGIINNTSLEVKTDNSVSRDSKKLINQLNYMLTNPQQSRQKRSQTSNSNYNDQNQSPISSNNNQINSIQQFSPKQLKIKLQKVESMEEVRTSTHGGVKKVDRLFSYLNELESKQHSNAQSQNATLMNQDQTISNIQVNYQSLPQQTQQSRIPHHLRVKSNNPKQLQQAISSYQQQVQEGNKSYIEDVDEIENHLNRKDIMIQILNNNNNISNLPNLSSKKQNPSKLIPNNNQQSAQQDVSSNNQFQINHQEMNKSDGNINQYTTFGEVLPNRGFYSNSQERRNNTHSGTIEKLNSNHPAYKKQKNQIKQIVQSQAKMQQNQPEQYQIEQILDEINENYSKVPLKPLIVSPSCAVKNTKRMIKKSRRGMQYIMAYPVEYYSDQMSTEFNLQSQQLQQQHSNQYNYNLNMNNKKTNQIEY